MRQNDRYYSMQEVASMLNIGIGRNKLLAFLRFKGLLDARNHAVLNARINECSFEQYVQLRNGEFVGVLRVNYAGFLAIKAEARENLCMFLANETRRKTQRSERSRPINVTVPAVAVLPELLAEMDEEVNYEL